SKDDNQKITWQNFKTSNSAYSKLCGKLSLFKSVPSRLIEKSAYCSTENMAKKKKIKKKKKKKIIITKKKKK
ncbi:hypothetical protein J4W49_24685, partial [Escherichia coli]